MALKYRYTAAVILTILVISSCSTFSAGTDYAEYAAVSEELTETQKKLTSAAYSLQGNNSSTITVKNKEFAADCSGAVLAMYYDAGIDLSKAYSEYEGNGVKRIYSYLRDRELILYSPYPMPGDLIFWDNTWDKDGNGKADDYFTHMGMVVSSDAIGNITFVHHNYRKGIVFARMNLLHPDDRALNSPMRMLGSPKIPGGKTLSSHLLRVFGRAWMLK